ncbi:IS66 family insertion sequence element accessory protein TnpA [Chitinophaga silvisoli]|uniref:Transposase n=1 Tax=Chitinophaga silvisoli TaxID=2291814 RepID=A0A3E1P3B3_9BACT|nr:hypothetical protein DXN04_15680 [Chitinophaga silvisoli]
MSSKAKKTIKSRLTPAQIRPLIENFERQGQSIKDFCQRYSISEVTFYNWRKKYGIKGSSSILVKETLSLYYSKPMISLRFRRSKLHLPYI